MPTLKQQLDAHLAEKKRLDAQAAGRCKPQCYNENWRDEPAKGGTIRTVCGICNTLIGYRPVAGKKGM